MYFHKKIFNQLVFIALCVMGISQNPLPAGILHGTKILTSEGLVVAEALTFETHITGYDPKNNTFPAVKIEQFKVGSTCAALIITTDKGVIRCDAQQHFYELTVAVENALARGTATDSGIHLSIEPEDFVMAKDLRPDDVLLNNKFEPCRCLKIEEMLGGGSTYDISLPPPHLFFSSDAKVLTHNWSPEAALAACGSSCVLPYSASSPLIAAPVVATPLVVGIIVGVVVVGCAWHFGGAIKSAAKCVVNYVCAAVATVAPAVEVVVTCAPIVVAVPCPANTIVALDFTNAASRTIARDIPALATENLNKNEIPTKPKKHDGDPGDGGGNDGGGGPEDLESFSKYIWSLLNLLDKNKEDHIMAFKHRWGLVDLYNNWQGIKELIVKTMLEGIDRATRDPEVFIRSLGIDNEIVEVTFRRVDGIIIKIGNAWIKDPKAVQKILF